MGLAYFQVNINLDSESVLYVGVKGLFKVRTPFFVQCVSPTAVHKVGDRVKVFKVIKDDDYELLYLTGKGYYSHHYFHFPYKNG